MVQNQRRVWNEIFDRVEIQTPDAREKSRFYTNLYRALSGRNTWSDVNGEWIDPDERVQQLTDPDAVMLGCDALVDDVLEHESGDEPDRARMVGALGELRTATLRQMRLAGQRPGGFGIHQRHGRRA